MSVLLLKKKTVIVPELVWVKWTQPNFKKTIGVNLTALTVAMAPVRANNTILRATIMPNMVFIFTAGPPVITDADN